MTFEEALLTLEEADRRLSSEDFAQPDKLGETMAARADAITWLEWAAQARCSPAQLDRLRVVREHGALMLERLRAERLRVAGSMQRLDQKTYVLRRFTESS